MKRLIIAVALCASALSACTPAGPVASNVAVKADTVVLSAERGFAVAELAYTTAANGAGRLVDAGVIHGATATWLRGVNSTARDLIVKGKATADTAEKARIAAQLFGFAAQIDKLNGGK